MSKPFKQQMKSIRIIITSVTTDPKQD